MNRMHRNSTTCSLTWIHDFLANLFHENLWESVEAEALPYCKCEKRCDNETRPFVAHLPRWFWGVSGRGGRFELVGTPWICFGLFTDELQLLTSQDWSCHIPCELEGLHIPMLASSDPLICPQRFALPVVKHQENKTPAN